MPPEKLLMLLLTLELVSRKALATAHKLELFSHMLDLACLHFTVSTVANENKSPVLTYFDKRPQPSGPLYLWQSFQPC